MFWQIKSLNKKSPHLEGFYHMDRKQYFIEVLSYDKLLCIGVVIIVSKVNEVHTSI